MGVVAFQSTSRDLLQLLQALYDVERATGPWLAGVLSAVPPWLQGELGVGAVLYDVLGQERLNVDALEGMNVLPAFVEVGRECHRDPGLLPAIIRAYTSTMCASLPVLARLHPEGVGRMRRNSYEPLGVKGQIFINGFDGSGKGFALYKFHSRAVGLQGAKLQLYERIAAHLATAYRLHRRLRDAARVPVEQAVLHPSGKVEHAEPEASSKHARAALTHAVQAYELAKRPQSDLEHVVNGRTALVAARWTIVDRYEEGGRRYLVARENGLAPCTLADLSRREQQVVALAAMGRANKLIAYELGMAHSTVRVLMSRATAKLSVRSREALVALARRENWGNGGSHPRAPAQSNLETSRHLRAIARSG